MSNHDAFTRGIATVLWGHKWADHAEGHGCCNLSGCRIEDYMPEIPEIAWQHAERVAGRIEGSIGYSWPVLFAAAMRAEGVKEPDYDGDEAQRFGECLCYKTQGHGVSWLDDHKDFELPDVLEPRRKFSETRIYGWTDEAERDLEDYAAEACESSGPGVRCPSCGCYNRPDRRDTCEGCGADVESSDDEILCEECAEPIVADASPGVWCHASGDAEGNGINHDADADHVARPPEGTLHPSK